MKLEPGTCSSSVVVTTCVTLRYTLFLELWFPELLWKRGEGVQAGIISTRQEWREIRSRGLTAPDLPQEMLNYCWLLSSSSPSAGVDFHLSWWGHSPQRTAARGHITGLLNRFRALPTGLTSIFQGSWSRRVCFLNLKIQNKASPPQKGKSYHLGQTPGLALKPL